MSENPKLRPYFIIVLCLQPHSTTSTPSIPFRAEVRIHSYWVGFFFLDSLSIAQADLELRTASVSYSEMMALVVCATIANSSSIPLILLLSLNLEE